MGYRIFTDATADLTPGMLAIMPGVTVLPMELTLGGRSYTYGPGGNITVEEFYAAQRAGQFASTSQISPSVYLRAFRDCLAQGEDLLYLCFTSGMSSTYQTACLCAEELRLRSGRRPSLLLAEGESPFGDRAVQPRDLDTVLENATRASAHRIR